MQGHTYYTRGTNHMEKKDFFITILITLITIFLEVCCLTIPGMMTWA